MSLATWKQIFNKQQAILKHSDSTVYIIQTLLSILLLSQYY